MTTADGGPFLPSVDCEEETYLRVIADEIDITASLFINSFSLSSFTSKRVLLAGEQKDELFSDLLHQVLLAAEPVYLHSFLFFLPRLRAMKGIMEACPSYAMSIHPSITDNVNSFFLPLTTQLCKSTLSVSSHKVNSCGLASRHPYSSCYPFM